MLFKLVLFAVLLLPATAFAQYVPVKPMQLTEYEWQRYQYLQLANLNYGGPVAQIVVGAAVGVGSAFMAVHFKCYSVEPCSTVWAGTGVGLVISLAAIPRIKRRSQLRRELRWLESKATVDFVRGPRLQYTFQF